MTTEDRWPKVEMTLSTQKILKMWGCLNNYEGLQITKLCITDDINNMIEIYEGQQFSNVSTIFAEQEYYYLF